MSEERHTVNESADKIRLKTEAKRGTGTRDQDKVNITVKGSDPEETAQKLKETLDALEAEGVAQQLRDTQPEAQE
jgi:phosphotransferase system HPr-like phosphotransfer protein